MAIQARGFLRVCIKFLAYRTKSTSTLRNEFCFDRKTRFIGKLLAENAAERKQWRKGLPTHKIFSPSSLSPKRLETLNRIFLANITDGLTTSTRCDELADLGLLIGRVQLTPCGQSLRVLWSSCSSEADKKVAKILEECQAEVRDNIVKKSVGGFIPRIIFTKDKEATLSRDIEHILSLPSVVKDLETELVKDNGEEDREEEERFQIELCTNILGLNREAVLRRVMTNVKRVRKAERRQKEEGITMGEESESVLPDRLANIDARMQKSMISAYIHQQKKAEKKSFLNAIRKIRQKELFEDLQDGEYSFEDELYDENEEENWYDSVDLEEKETVNAEENNDENSEESVNETVLGEFEKRPLQK